MTDADRPKPSDPERVDPAVDPVVVRPLLDASKRLDLDRVESEFSATIEERKDVEAKTQRAFRSEAGSPSPSAVVQSAEGPMLFPGLHISNNGPLNKVAREALREKFAPPADAPEDEPS